MRKFGLLIVTALLLLSCVSFGEEQLPTLPKEEHSKIFALTTKYLNAVRLGDAKQMKLLVDPSSADARILGSDPAKYVRDSQSRFDMVADHNPVKITSFNMASCSWRMTKSLVDYVYTKSPDNLSPSNLAVVEYRYPYQPVTGLLLVRKGDSGWIMCSLLYLTTNVYKFETVWDAVIRNEKDVVSSTKYPSRSHQPQTKQTMNIKPKVVKSTIPASDGSQDAVSLPKEEQLKIIAMTTKYLNALRLGDVGKMKQITDTLSSDSELLDRNPAKYVRCYQGVYDLIANRGPVNTTSFRIGSCPWKMTMSLVNYTCGESPGNLNPSNLAVVEYHNPRQSVTWLILVRKVDHQWIMCSLPPATTDLYKYKTIWEALVSDDYDVKGGGKNPSSNNEPQTEQTTQIKPKAVISSPSTFGNKDAPCQEGK